MKIGKDEHCLFLLYAEHRFCVSETAFEWYLDFVGLEPRMGTHEEKEIFNVRPMGPKAGFYW